MSLKMAVELPNSEWVPPSELPDIFDATQIAIDVETKDPNIKTSGPGWPTGDGYVVGYAVAVDGWQCYLPIRHKGGGNLDERIVNKWLRKVFACPADKIMHNAQYVIMKNQCISLSVVMKWVLAPKLNICKHRLYCPMVKVF